MQTNMIVYVHSIAEKGMRTCICLLRIVADIYTWLGIQKSSRHKLHAQTCCRKTATPKSGGVGERPRAQSPRHHIARVPIASTAAARHAVANMYTSRGCIAQAYKTIPAVASTNPMTAKVTQSV